MPEKPEGLQPDVVADDELEDVTGGLIFAPQNSTSPLAGADGRPLDFPA